MDGSTQVPARCVQPIVVVMSLKSQCLSVCPRNEQDLAITSKTAPLSVHHQLLRMKWCAAVMATSIHPVANSTCSTVGEYCRVIPRTIRRFQTFNLTHKMQSISLYEESASAHSRCALIFSFSLLTLT